MEMVVFRIVVKAVMVVAVITSDSDYLLVKQICIVIDIISQYISVCSHHQYISVGLVRVECSCTKRRH